MMVNSALCFILVLASTSASEASKPMLQLLLKGTGKWLTTNTIASTIIEELIRVADALKGTNISAEELRERLLDATRNALKKQDYDHGLFRDFGTNSVDVADIVVHKLNQNEALQRALPCDGDTTYHAIAKIVMDWGGWIHGAARERSN